MDKEKGQTTQWIKEKGQTTQWIKEKGQTTQWSITTSVTFQVFVTVCFVVISLSLVGIICWREFM
jgi:hypothetical protein